MHRGSVLYIRSLEAPGDFCNERSTLLAQRAWAVEVSVRLSHLFDHNCPRRIGRFSARCIGFLCRGQQVRCPILSVRPVRAACVLVEVLFRELF